jgi:structure-specific recognition protein 1
MMKCHVEFRVAASGMAWKGAESEGVTAMASTDIKWAQWMRVARGSQLRIGMKDHKREKFDGFSREVRIFSIAVLKY